MKLLTVSCLLMTVSCGLSSGFFEDNSRGWHWYEMLEPEVRDQKPKEQLPASKQSSDDSHPRTAQEKLKTYRDQLEESLAKAILDPTLRNIQAYQEKQKEMMDRAQFFSQVWMQNVMAIPHLDHTIQFPVNQTARHIYLDQEKERTKQTIKALSQEYGLFFFFSSTCAYCHTFAPIVKRFSEAYQWEVVAIALDGGSLEAFPQAVPDNGLAQQWKIEVLPSLYAVNPNTGHVIPVAYGMTSLDDIEARILLAADSLQPSASKKGQP